MRLLYRFAQRFLLAALLNGCSVQTLPPAPIEPPTERFFVHTVSIPGESLSVLAQWYTGDWRDWGSFLIPASAGAAGHLELGDPILIPSELIRTQASPDARYISRFQGKQAPQTPPPLLTPPPSSLPQIEEPSNELAREFLDRMVSVDEGAPRS